MSDNGTAASGTPAATPPTGAGRGRGGRFQYRRGGHGGRGSGAARRNNRPQVPAFEGRDPNLKGFIYDFRDGKTADQFVKTTKEIARYVGRKYTEHTAEFVHAVEHLELTMPTAPKDPKGMDVVSIEKWKHEFKEYNGKDRKYKDFLAWLYGVVLGQCTEALEDRLNSHNLFAAAMNDGVKLLRIIKVLTYTVEETIHLPDSLMVLKEGFYTFKQNRGVTLQQYYEQFKTKVAVMDEMGVQLYDQRVAEQYATEGNRTNPNANDYRKARDSALAIRFIRGARNGQKYYKHLRNSYLDSNNVYPSSAHVAYNILLRREEGNEDTTVADFEGVAFANNGVAGGRRDRSTITCFACQQTGHYASDCPYNTRVDENNGMSNSSSNANTNENNSNENNQEGTQLLTNGVESEHFAFSQAGDGHQIPTEWILLDNQSTVDVFCNEDLLLNIREADGSMTVHSNGGPRTTNMIGDLPGYGTVWFDPAAIANILSLSRVRKKAYTVSYDSNSGDEFVVTNNTTGKVMRFRPTKSGLYYLDTTKEKKNNKTTGVAMTLSTVDDNKSKYTNADYFRAKGARALQIKIGRPSTRTFTRIVTNNLLPNCPYTRQDIQAAEDIFGPDLGSIKGKTVRRSPRLVRTAPVSVPSDVMSRYRKITLAVDIMYVDKIPFLVTLSRNIRFGTVEVLADRKQHTIVRAIKNVQALYVPRGFTVETALMDGEFVALRGDLAELGITINETAADEHVGDIERYIRTIKERTRSTYNTLPFNKMPARMVAEMVKASVFWLNAFPHDLGISRTESPRAIVTGQRIDFNLHCKYEFGEYVQTHEQHDNTMATRTVGALALRPTGNAQGGHYFFSLSTGRVINRSHATRLPMPAEVIDRVHVLARRQQGTIIFRNRDGTGIDDDDNDNIADDNGDDDDSTYHPGDDDSDDDSGGDDTDGDETDYDGDDPDQDDRDVLDDDTDADPAAGVNGPNDADEAHQNANNPPEFPSIVSDHSADDDESTGVLPPIPESTGVPPTDSDLDTASEPAAPESDDSESLTENNDEDNTESTGVATNHEDRERNIEEEMNERYGERGNRYNLRPRRERQYGHLHTTTAMFQTSQMTMKKGLKMFGKQGEEAVKKELQQLHERAVIKPIAAPMMTRDEKRKSLQYLMFLKRKRCGKIKARGCADGRPQRLYTAKEDSTSPTVAIESVFLTSVIDALEGRDVATVDVPGAFMQADMDEKVHVRLTGTMVKLLVEIDPDRYGPMVVHERGEQVLYVRLLKALYGTLRAARLFWEKLTRKLQEWGFVINPYDPCVANKMINDKQCTITWHVDDLKISHVDPKVVDSVIEEIEEEFGQEAPLSKTRGKVHEYLGMRIDYSKPGKVMFDMSDYVANVLSEVPEDMLKGNAATPAAAHLFEVNEDAEPLDKERAEQFHQDVMKLMFLAQRARPDIRTAVAFLSTRVNKSDKDDYKKLARVMKYLRDTADMPLTLEANSPLTVKWWVDASFAVHHDMKGHTGASMSLRRGGVYNTSS